MGPHGTVGVDGVLVPETSTVVLFRGMYILLNYLFICLASASSLGILTKLLGGNWYEAVKDCVIMVNGPVY